jgi:cyclic-di-GMP-binding biofilm dispersal mediator protein
MAERELQGAVVAVVGASGGLGSAVCAELTARDATVVACGPHVERIVAAGVTSAGVVELDIRDPSAGDVLAAALADLGGRLDGLVNVAGVVVFGDLVDTDDAIIEELFLTDVIGPLWLLKRVVPLLAESKGFVAQLSAVVGEQPMAGMAAYSSAKAALTAADTALARELRRKGITVCDVRPPHTETGLAGRPIAGEAPRLKEGLSPSSVATLVVDAIAAGATDVPAATFTS